MADTTEGSSSTTGPELSLIERIVEGLGGEEALGELVNVELDVSGDRAIIDELFAPSDPAAVVSTFDTTVSLDFETSSIRNDINRTVQFLQPPPMLQITEWVVPTGGYVGGIESIFGAPTGDMLSDRLASTARQAALLNPHFFVFDLLEDASTASEAGTDDFDGTTYDLLEITDEFLPTVTLWVDQDTDLIRRLTTMENSHLRRDVTLEALYGDWADTKDGVMFPNEVQILVGGELFHDERRNEVITNAQFAPDLFDLPPEANPAFDLIEFGRGLLNHQHNQAFVSLGIPIDGLQLGVVGDQIAPGVYHITGGSHHSMIVQQENGVVVFDAPLNPQRSEAMLLWIAMNLGGAQVTHIVQSHHHTDHAAGVRTFVATGAALVVHQSTEAFYADILAAPSTVEPDRLEMNPVMDPVIEVVPMGGSFVIDDMANPVEVYDMPSTHAEDMVLPFVSSSGVAFTVDIYSPGGAALDPAGPTEVLDAMDFHGIRPEVAQVAGGHGGVGPIADLEMQAGG